MSDNRYVWRRRIGGWLTPAFRFYWRRTRAMTLGVRVLATDSDGRICLVRHSYIDGWHLPGGGVEPGESVQLSAEREVAEEAGLCPEPGALTLAGVYRNLTFAGDHIVLFHLHRWTPCAPAGDGEITDRIWARPDRLPQDTGPATRRRIEEYLGAREPGRDW